jgi:hypothetical protein
LLCKFYEIDDQTLCTDDNAWRTDRETCKEKCDTTVGCQSFTYSDAKGQCWLSRLNEDTVDTVQDNEDYESWTTECTTTTQCELCLVECPFAHVLDLRFVAWSNLGGLGPNKTIYAEDKATGKGQLHQVPPTIMYYNVFNATKAEDVVYLVVSNISKYDGDASLNGVSRESEKEFKTRQKNDQSAQRMEGAYGSVNVAAGTSTLLKFQFQNAKLSPIVPRNVVAMTFLDIDQPKVGNRKVDATIAKESVGICTGRESFGWPNISTLNHTFFFKDSEVDSVGRRTTACHNFSSTKRGDVNDNPWNPANVRDDEKPGLEDDQLEKLFTAAYWNVDTFTASFEVKEDVHRNRNFLFAGHATSFCEQERACRVKENYCDLFPDERACVALQEAGQGCWSCENIQKTCKTAPTGKEKDCEDGLREVRNCKNPEDKGKHTDLRAKNIKSAIAEK